ncbi:MAG: inorganic diphosphatase [Malacoplasma sp.]
MKLNVTIEIPKNSKIKYEYDRKTKEIIVDRILYGSSPYPLNYGFIKEALDWDGDELDALIVSDQEFLPGVIVPTRLIGAMEMIDGNEVDTKLICVIDCDPRYDEINSLDDLPKHTLLEIQDFFENYKNLQKKKVEIKGFRDKGWALDEYKECVELMTKYGKMDKKEFINEMKKKHPNKYK